MTSLRPRQTSHRGCVMAAGLAIDTRITAEQEARRRILRLPSRSLGVFRIGPMLVVRFPAPARLDAALADGALLVRYDRLLSAAPLDADEQELLGAHPGAVDDAVVLVEGGSASARPLGDDARIDISEWIDVSGFSVARDLHALGIVQSEPQSAAVAPVGTARQSFGMAPLDREAAETLQALLRGPAQGGVGGAPARQSFLRRALEALWLGLRGLSRPAPAGGGREAAGHGAAGAKPQSPRPGVLSALRDFFARAAWSSQLGRLLGRRYAAYLSRVLDMLDAQDYDNALRHAVPLSDEVAAALRPPPLGLPAARADLAIRPVRPAAVGTSLGVGGALFELLRQSYRRAFERLDALGDVEKAAFVLAELLNAPEEAVSYLERHRRLRLAAELAEGRKLQPGLVIRLWFLAGDRGRAVQIARLTGAFADAVLRLEATHKEEGRVLRLVWADALASAGAYAAAVDAAWPVEDARHLARYWMDRAIAVGGPAGARMLARKIRIAPEEFAGLRDQALELLGRSAEDDAAAVRAFAQELADHEPTAEVRVLASPTVRRLLAENSVADLQRLTDRLLAVTAPVFAADVRTWQQGRGSPRAGGPGRRPPDPPLSSRLEPLDIHRPADDGGGIAVTDAAMLPDGRMLAAAGELGVFLLSRDGKVMTRFAEPAHAIVISDQGDCAILLARRGEMFRVSRLDLVTRRLQPWCDARFTRFAPDFDGSVWFVARSDTLYAIDATAARWSHMWKVDERGAVFHAVARDARWMSAVVVGQERCEVWTFEQPSITLRSRQPIDWDREGRTIGGMAAVAPYGLLVGWQDDPSAAQDRHEGHDDPPPVAAIATDADGHWTRLPVTAPQAPKNAVLSRAWIALPASEWRGGAHPPSRQWRTVIHVADTISRVVRARITLDGGGPALARIQGDRLLAFDGCGRVIAVSLSTGAVLREHRLT